MEKRPRQAGWPVIPYAMVLLDCESRQSTYSSIAQIFGIGREEIDRLLNLSDPILREPEFWRHGEADEIVDDTFRTAVATEPRFDGVCWFHFTRVLPGTDFSAGIAPVGDRLDEIWDLLFAMLPSGSSRSQWKQFRHRMLDSQHEGSRTYRHYAGLYRLKTQDRRMMGPFGRLLKFVAFEKGRHDLHYLRIPETIQDICSC